MKDAAELSYAASLLRISRQGMVAAGSPKVFNGTITFLLKKSEAGDPPARAQALAPGEKPAEPGDLSPQSEAVLDRVRESLPEKKEQAERALKDYEQARKDFERWYRENITGKSRDQLSQALLNEMKRRSDGVKRLEQSLRQLTDVPDELEEAFQRLRRAPRKFLDFVENGQWDGDPWVP